MIVLNKINKVASKVNQVILDDISLQIKQNEFVVIKGPSGAGKTTLINVIGGIASFEGEYLFDNNKISKDKDMQMLRKKYISFLVQDFALINNMSVEHNLKLVVKNIDMDILTNFNVEKLLKKKVKFLSGGEKQRVALVRAILMNKTLIICDEPTGNLDQKNSEKIMNYLIELHKNGKTIILVTHEEKYYNIGTRLIEVEDGKIKSDVQVM